MDIHEVMMQIKLIKFILFKFLDIFQLKQTLTTSVFKEFFRKE